MPFKTVTIHRWKVAGAFVALAISFSAAVAWGTHLSHEVNKKNSDRIADIQQGRLESCQRTYEGIRQAFRPFLPPPRARSRIVRLRLHKFNTNIDRLKAQCAVQIHAGSGP